MLTRSWWFTLGLALLSCDDRTRLVPALALNQPTCIAGDFELARTTPAVMLVLDRSGSMATAFGSGSRWSTLRTTLSQTLPSLGTDVDIGAFIYPSTTTGGASCEVPSAASLTPAANQAKAVASLMSSTSTGGATPTADAIDEAASALEQSVATDRPRALVLATDGAPNCNPWLNPATCTCVDAQGCSSAQRCLDDERTVTRLSRWASAGLSTWVIGIASDATMTKVLDAMANAGGRPHSGAHAFFAGNSPAELEAAFGAIDAQLSACVLVSPSVPDATGTISVELGTTTLPLDSANGWMWGSLERGELVLRGEACARSIASRESVIVRVRCGSDDGGVIPVAQ